MTTDTQATDRERLARLRDELSKFTDAHPVGSLRICMTEARAIVAALDAWLSSVKPAQPTADVEGLVAALRPFADLAAYFDAATLPLPDHLALNRGMTLGDCRRAAKCLAAYEAHREKHHD